MGKKLPRILPKVATSTSLLGSFTCRKFTTWDRRLYFPSEGRRAEDFFARKIRQLQLGLNPRTRVPKASTLTSRPPKPLIVRWVEKFYEQSLVIIKCSLSAIAGSSNIKPIFDFCHMLQGIWWPIFAQASLILVLSSCSVIDSGWTWTLFVTYSLKNKSISVRAGDLRNNSIRLPCLISVLECPSAAVAMTIHIAYHSRQSL